MSDRLATIVKGNLKYLFQQIIPERKWKSGYDDALDRLASFFTELDKRIFTLEQRGGEAKLCPVCNEPKEKLVLSPTAALPEMEITEFVGPKSPSGVNPRLLAQPAPTPATVERFKVFEFRLDREIELCGRWLRKPIGEVVAMQGVETGRWWVCLPSSYGMELSDIDYRALVTMMVDNKYWEKVNE